MANEQIDALALVRAIRRAFGSEWVVRLEATQ